MVGSLRQPAGRYRKPLTRSAQQTATLQRRVEDDCGALPDASPAINVAVERAQALSRMLVNGKAGASVDDFLRDRSADGEGTPVTVG